MSDIYDFLSEQFIDSGLYRVKAKALLSKVSIKDLQSHIHDTFKHKHLVLECAEYMAGKLFESDDEEDHITAILLIQRAASHDNSKLGVEEAYYFCEIIDDKSCLGNCKATMTNFKKQCIQTHWNNNRHHPEYYDNSKNMTKDDCLEMVCDWAARSIEFGTPLIPYVTYQQEHRFHFNDKIFDYLILQCKGIDDFVNEQIRKRKLPHTEKVRNRNKKRKKLKRG